METNKEAMETKAKPDLSDAQLHEAARALGARGAASRAIVESACVVCGTAIQGTKKKRYCSNTCAVRASRQRRAASAPAP